MLAFEKVREQSCMQDKAHLPISCKIEPALAIEGPSRRPSDSIAAKSDFLASVEINVRSRSETNSLRFKPQVPESLGNQCRK